MNRRLMRAFSLIEILIVMVILALLAIFLVPRLTGKVTDTAGRQAGSPRHRAEQVVGVSYVEQINQAIQMYRMDHDNQNPPDLQSLKTYGVNDEMLMDPATRQPLRYDPSTGRVIGSQGPDSLGGGKALPQIPGF